jgi:outer membrane murein-binding lipoprotein Lpp
MDAVVYVALLAAVVAVTVLACSWAVSEARANRLADKVALLEGRCSELAAVKEGLLGRVKELEDRDVEDDEDDDGDVTVGELLDFLAKQPRDLPVEVETEDGVFEIIGGMTVSDRLYDGVSCRRVVLHLDM